MKIDVFSHVLPNGYREALVKRLPPAVTQPFQAMWDIAPALCDLESRFAEMDRHEGLVQIINITVPFLEQVAGPETVTELVRLGNDELAALVVKFPARFVAAIGNLPMHDVDAALSELDRIVGELDLRGIQLCTDVNGRALDAPEFRPLFARLAEYDLPVLLHPARPATLPDYPTEDASKYRIFHMLGWPYDTSAAMVRLVLGGVLPQYPGLKFITHHFGGMIPYFDSRMMTFFGDTGGAAKPLLEYFKSFYADTALSGSISGLTCGYAFFGADHVLFGTDAPYGSYPGHPILTEVINSVEKLDITDAEREKIFAGNARRLFRLSV